MSDTDIPAVPSTPFSPDEVVLYGTPVETRNGVRVSTGTDRMATFAFSATDAEGELTLAAIHGYGFEGVCYRFGEPRVLAFRPEGNAETASGCGYTDSYRMWRVDRRASIACLRFEGGPLQEKLLDFHADDDRSAATYASKFQMVHRHPHG